VICNQRYGRCADVQCGAAQDAAPAACAGAGERGWEAPGDAVLTVCCTVWWSCAVAMVPTITSPLQKAPSVSRPHCAARAAVSSASRRQSDQLTGRASNRRTCRQQPRAQEAAGESCLTGALARGAAYVGCSSCRRRSPCCSCACVAGNQHVVRRASQAPAPAVGRCRPSARCSLCCCGHVSLLRQCAYTSIWGCC
jgi:hypothetical protein